MTIPHVDLGNSFQDVGQGTNSFAAGLLAQRQRQQQIALQTALAASKMASDAANTAHTQAETENLIPAQTEQMHAQTSNLGAQTAGRTSENLPADDSDEEVLRRVDPDAPKGIYQGMTKAQAAENTKVIANYNATKQRIASITDRFENRGQVAYDPNGNTVLIRPNQPYGGGAQPIGTPTQSGFLRDNVGKPLNPSERAFAGAGQAAESAHNDLTQFEQTNIHALDEIAKAISLPNFGRIVPFGPGEGISRVLQAFRLSGASPEAQAYLKRMFDFAGVVGPKRYGLRGMQSEVTLQQLWTDFGAGQFGLTRQGIEAAEKNRANAILQLRESAGPRAWDQSEQIFPQTQSQPTGPQASPYGYKR